MEAADLTLKTSPSLTSTLERLSDLLQQIPMTLPDEAQTLLEQAHQASLTLTTDQQIQELRDYKYALDEHSIVAVTDQTGRITYVNDKFCQISQFNRDELLGQDHRIINSGHHPKTFIRDLWVTLANGRVWKGEFRNRAKDGSYYWVDTTIVPFLNEQNKPYQYVAIRTDITQRKAAEAERERLIRELEEALLFKDQFLATMSHELRTPLNAILGFSGIALAKGGLPPQATHMFERIKINSKRLLALINDILDISRINAKRITLVERPISLSALVTGWVNDLEQTVAEKGLEFSLELDPALPEKIVGDEERLTQITNNLLVNAVKFTETGSIKLAVSRLGADRWQIRVTDTGQGIPETWQHLIFEEFRQVDGSSRRKYGGAGLGLSIVQKLCMMMGGTVGVTSKLGEGSIFTIILPLHQAEEGVTA